MPDTQIGRDCKDDLNLFECDVSAGLTKSSALKKIF